MSPSPAASLPAPTIHLNGTNGQELLDQIITALRAVILAQEALQGAAPHARDYYPQGNDAFDKAQRAHHARLQKLEAVRLELEAIGECIADRIE